MGGTAGVRRAIHHPQRALSRGCYGMRRACRALAHVAWRYLLRGNTTHRHIRTLRAAAYCGTARQNDIVPWFGVSSFLRNASSVSHTAARQRRHQT